MPHPSISILIIDDSETNLLLLESILTGKDWEIHTANSGQKAMDMISAGKPDLILLDLLMPGIDGHQMMHWLKSNEKLKNIPVIIISAINNALTRDIFLNKGAVDFMSKPVKASMLVSRIQKLLAREADD